VRVRRRQAKGLRRGARRPELGRKVAQTVLSYKEVVFKLEMDIVISKVYMGLG